MATILSLSQNSIPMAIINEKSSEIEQEQQGEEQQTEEEIDTSPSAVFDSSLKELKQVINRIEKNNEETLGDLLRFYWLELPSKLMIIDMKLSMIQQQLQAQGVFPEDTTISDLMNEIRQRRRRRKNIDSG